MSTTSRENLSTSLFSTFLTHIVIPFRKILLISRGNKEYFLRFYFQKNSLYVWGMTRVLIGIQVSSCQLIDVFICSLGGLLCNFPTYSNHTIRISIIYQ